MARIVFMGTPDFAVPALGAIAGHGHEVAAVYTQPARAAGRGMAARKSPVHLFAETLRLDVRTPHSLKDAETLQALSALAADALVVIAYGQILPRAALEAGRLGAFNIHASLLPRWRGAAPIQRAIMAGDAETGVAVMRMQEGLDTGPVCMEDKVLIGPDMTAGELHDVLAARGAELVVRALAALERGALECREQDRDGVSYAAKISKDETRIDWSRPAAEIHNHIRALSPFPGAWCEMALGGTVQRVKILRSALAKGSGAPGTLLDDALTIACGGGAVRLVELQRAGRQAMSADEFLRGSPLAAGAALG